MATITIKKYTVPEVLKKWSNKTGANMTQSDLARFLDMNRQQIGALKNKPIPEKYYYKIDELLDNTNCEDNITLDYFPETFGSCGTGVFEFSTRKESLSIPKKSFFTRISPLKNYFIINAYGNSMQPLIYDKDKLIIENYDGEQIIDNRVYVFCYHDEIFIKKLVKNVNQLVIIPENNIYDTIKLTNEEINEVDIIGQVVGLIRDIR